MEEPIKGKNKGGLVIGENGEYPIFEQIVQETYDQGEKLALKLWHLIHNAS